MMTDTVHLVEYNGEIIETTVTNKASVARHWLQNIIRLSSETQKRGRSYRIVGMDCKYARHPIASKSDKISTLQLCVDTRCLVLQLLHMDGSSVTRSMITDFLSDSRATFVGVEIQENSQKLLEEYAIDVNRRVDLHYLARKWFPVSYRGRPSLKALAYGVVGLSMREKSDDRYDQCRRDWESNVLDQELVEQACTDAYACYTIAHKLLQDD